MRKNPGEPMRTVRRWALIASLLVAVATTACIPVDTADAQQLAIDFEAVDLAGNPFRGLDLHGKWVLLDFWAVWCAPCMDAFPKLNGLVGQLDPGEFEIVGMTVYSGTP